MKFNFETTTDYINAWKEGRYSEVMDSLYDYIQDPRLNKFDQIHWLMVLSSQMREALKDRSGHGGYGHFLKEINCLGLKDRP